MQKQRNCPNGIFYTIAVGETLQEISNREKISLLELLRCNPYLNPNRYFAGQVIILPNHHKKGKNA